MSTDTATAEKVVVLAADNVTIRFDGRDQNGDKTDVLACNKVSLALHEGEIVALVGESGSGKTTLARTLSRVYEPDEGKVKFRGKPVPSKLSRKDYYKDVQLIYQDPFASLNSLKTIRHILGRVIRIHHPKLSNKQVTARILELLELVALSPGEDYIDRYPTSLSGGQRQRISIARALAVEPDVILADEPTSMLDVSIRLDVLNLLDKIRQERGVAILFITHDIASARYVSDRMNVMYSGELVESGPTEELVFNPKHPYTQLLLDSAPDPSRRKTEDVVTESQVGEPADPSLKIQGCRFSPRCLFAAERCTEEKPPLFQVEDGQAKCWLYDTSDDPRNPSRDVKRDAPSETKENPL